MSFSHVRALHNDSTLCKSKKYFLNLSSVYTFFQIHLMCNLNIYSSGWIHLIHLNTVESCHSLNNLVRRDLSSITNNTFYKDEINYLFEMLLKIFFRQSQLGLLSTSRRDSRRTDNTPPLPPPHEQQEEEVDKKHLPCSHCHHVYQWENILKLLHVRQKQLADN